MSLRAFAFGVGRINRRTFWLWHSLLLATGLIASIGIVAAFGVRGIAIAPRLSLVLVWVVLDGLWTAQAVRRLHDFGKGAAWAFAPQLLWLGLMGAGFFLPLIGLPEASSWARTGLAAAGVVTSIGLTSLIWLGLKRGDHAANAYGPPTWISHPDPPAAGAVLPKEQARPK